MPLFHFKLVDSRIVTDHGVHDLSDATSAQIEAIKLVRSTSCIASGAHRHELLDLGHG